MEYEVYRFDPDPIQGQLAEHWLYTVRCHTSVTS